MVKETKYVATKIRKNKTKYIVFDGSYKQFVYLGTH